MEKEANPVEDSKAKNETLTTELHYELLKDYAQLSSATIGAVVFLIQLAVLSFDSNIYMSLGIFVFSIFTSLIGQDLIVDSLAKAKTIYDITKKLKIFRSVSMFSQGQGLDFCHLILFRKTN